MQWIRAKRSNSTVATRNSFIKLRFKLTSRSSHNERMRKVMVVLVFFFFHYSNKCKFEASEYAWALSKALSHSNVIKFSHACEYVKEWKTWVQHPSNGAPHKFLVLYSFYSSCFTMYAKYARLIYSKSCPVRFDSYLNQLYNININIIWSWN